MTLLNKITESVKTLNPKVKKPEAIAQRYIDAVCSAMIYGFVRADQHQLILGICPVSFDALRKECGTYKNPTSKYYFKELNALHPLFKVVQKGSNLTRKQTMVEPDIPIEILVAGTSQQEIVQAIYKDFDPESDIDLINIDTANLTRYIKKMKQDYNKTIKDKNILHASLIVKVAEAFNGVLPQVIHESNFGRKYYRGLNLQSCSKEVRHAALGKCYSVDISNSVFNWRYSNFPKDGQKLLINTRCYLLEKDRIRKHLAQATFGNTEKYSINTVKKVMTAISFGAKGETNSWFKDATGAWTKGSISEIIKSPEYRKRFFEYEGIDFSMKEFMHEQDYINEYLLKHKFVELRKDPMIREICATEGGNRISNQKLLALMYQTDERKVMTELMNWADSKMLLMVHDGCYYKGKPDLASMNTVLQDHWPLAKLDMEQIKSWQFVDNSFNSEDYEHDLRIRLEEKKANDGAILAAKVKDETHIKPMQQVDPHIEPDYLSDMEVEFLESIKPKHPSFMNDIFEKSKSK